VVRFILTFLIGYVLLRVVTILIASFKSGYKNRPSNSSNTNSKRRSSVTVDYNPQKGKKPAPKVGEYVDYEEITENKND
jgi:hypothetical protein